MKHNKTLRRGLGILISLIMCLGLLPVTALAGESGESTDVEISEANFPDANFRDFVKDYDLGSSNSLSEGEIANVTKMNLFGKSIFNLKGIEYFTNLETLLCGLNNLTSVDVSSNTNLRNLDISNNSVDTLVLNTGIQLLTCNNNKLKSLDVSNFNSLSTLNCVKNEIETLRVNSGLTNLSCYDNKLQQLDLSGNTNLKALYCQRNQLSYLNLGNTDITSRIDAADNSYTITIGEDRTYDLSTLPGRSFDVNKVVEGSWSDGCSVSGNILTLDPDTDSVTYDYQCKDGITVTFTLTTIDPEAGKIEINSTNFPDDVFREYVSDEFDTNNDDYLDNDEIKEATEIDVYDELVIESLTGIEYFTELKELDCAGNKLTTLDISNNTKVEMLDCDNNSLTKLKIGKNESLTDLYCSENQLTTLDVSQNTGLINLQCEDNNLTSLNLSKNTALEDLYCSGNQLTYLDVSSNEYLSTLSCSGNQLTYLDLSNTQVSSLSASNNVYEITLNEGRTFDLSTLPGGKFNADMVSSYDDSIGTIDNNTAVLTLASGADEFTYSYNCGKYNYVNFKLKVKSGGGDTDDTNKYTVTAEGLYGTAMGITPGETYTHDYATGAEVVLVIGKREGYTVDSCTVGGIDGEIEWTGEKDSDNYGIKFTMPENNVTVTVNWTANGSGGDVEINEYNFPDENFRTYVSDNIDTNQNGYLDSDEIQAVTSINVSYKGIGNLTGISYFTNLNTLNCEDNNLTALDVSQNKNLRNLYCDYNQLTTLDVSQNTSLSYLKCSFNQLTDLNVSGANILTDLYCGGNKLTYLDVSSNAALQYLVCSDNNLIYLNVSSNTWIMCLGNTYVLAEGSTTLELPEDFDTSKVSDMNGGSISGNTLTFDEGSTKVTYNYKCSDRYTAAFAIYTAAHPKCTVTASGMYEMDGITEKTFSGEYFAEDTVSLQIGMRNGYTLESLTLVGISEKDITWNTKEENYTRTISFTMPGNPVTITVNWTANGTGEEGGDDETKYTVTASGFYEGVFGNETGAPFTLSRAAGDTVDMLISMREGYTLKDLTLVGISEKDITWNTKEETTQRMIWFTMPANPVTITVNWTANGTGGGSSSGGGGGTATPKYSVTAPENIENGTVTISPKNASAGSKVTVTVTPDEGFALESLVIKDENGKEIKLTDNGNGKYTFTMPSGKVTVEPSFKVETPEFVEPEKTAGAENPFTDVSADAYYYDAVLWAVEKGITSGTTETTFSPDASCTRAQMLTFMWRAAGSPKATGSNPFTDVSADAYYYDAVLWAVENGITSGISATTFAPDATVTRDQTVTFLYRMAGSPAANGSSFSDVSSDAYYADAVAWAVQQNITSGTGDGQFSPNADCTRAQIVTFLYRYMG